MATIEGHASVYVPAAGGGGVAGGGGICSRMTSYVSGGQAITAGTMTTITLGSSVTIYEDNASVFGSLSSNQVAITKAGWYLSTVTVWLGSIAGTATSVFLQPGSSSAAGEQDTEVRQSADMAGAQTLQMIDGPRYYAVGDYYSPQLEILGSTCKVVQVMIEVELVGSGGGGLVGIWRFTLGSGGDNHYGGNALVIPGTANVDLLAMLDQTDFPAGDSATNIYAPYVSGVAMTGQVAESLATAVPAQSVTAGWAFYKQAVAPGTHDFALMQNGVDPFNFPIGWNQVTIVLTAMTAGLLHHIEAGGA